MIDAINNNSGMFAPPKRPQGNASLSGEQKQLITDTLAKFDVDALTEDDAKSIISTFDEAGIQPGKEMAEAMESAGFDARAIGEMGGAQRPPPREGTSQGQESGLNLSEDAMKELYSLLDSYYADTTSDKDKTSLADSIQSLLASKLGSESTIFSAKV